MEAAVELKLRILSEGLSVQEEARTKILGERRKTLAPLDYVTTSGITIELQDQVYVNAPISESSSIALEFRDGALRVRHGRREVRARVLPLPEYLDRQNSDGVPYSYLVATQTDRVRVSPIAGCAFRCEFCDLPYSFKYQLKQIPHLVAAVNTALTDSLLPARHVLVSGGTPTPGDRDYLIEAIRAVTKGVRTPVDVMMVPWEDPRLFEMLWEVGIHQLFLNLELAQDGPALRFMPQKAKRTRVAFLNSIGQAVAQFGEGRVSSLLLVGLESPQATLDGVENLCQLGCTPVLSPFRPSPVTPLRDYPLPSFHVLQEVHEKADQIARGHGIRLGPSCNPCQHNTLTFPGDIT